jgi:hypothetical protein
MTHLVVNIAFHIESLNEFNITLTSYILVVWYCQIFMGLASLNQLTKRHRSFGYFYLIGLLVENIFLPRRKNMKGTIVS